MLSQGFAPTENLAWLLLGGCWQAHSFNQYCPVSARFQVGLTWLLPSWNLGAYEAANQSALGRKALEATTSIPNMGPGLFQKMRFVFQQMIGFLGSTDLKVSQFLGRFMRRAPKEVPQECQAGQIGQKTWCTPELK